MSISTAEKSIVQLAENPAKLLQAWQQLQTQHEGALPLYARDAAEKLGVTEAQLLATRCGQGVTRLTTEWKELLPEIAKLGKILSMVRNNYAIHELKGAFENVSIGHEGQEKIGLVKGSVLDIRFFLYDWASAFAVVDTKADGKEKLSLQFFDKYGNAIEKIHLLEDSNKEAFADLVTRFANPIQDTIQPIAPRKVRPSLPDAEIDLAAFRNEWSEMKDIHDYELLLRKHKVNYAQALRLAGTQWAEPLKGDSLRVLLDKVSKSELPLMYFVMNNGILQIFSGKITTVKPIHGFLNILDGEFNLHVVEEGIARIWIVRKPTVAGHRTVIEFYDNEDQLILSLFGKNKPGIPENPEWTQLAESLPKQ